MNVSYTDNYLNISSSGRIDLNVFLNQPVYFPYYFTEGAGRCSYFEVFSYTRDLFAAFCSVVVRMYLNITTKYFSNLISQLSLSDEKRVIQKIFKFAHQLLHKFFDINYFEIFDLFGQVNASDCYVICSNKPKYGPYHGPKGTLEIIILISHV